MGQKILPATLLGLVFTLPVMASADNAPERAALLPDSMPVMGLSAEACQQVCLPSPKYRQLMTGDTVRYWATERGEAKGSGSSFRAAMNLGWTR